MQYSCKRIGRYYYYYVVILEIEQTVEKNESIEFIVRVIYTYKK